MRDIDGKPVWTDDEVAELRAIIAERRSTREKQRPTPELLDCTARLIELLIMTHQDTKDGSPKIVGGQDWKHLVTQLRDGATYFEGQRCMTSGATKVANTGQTNATTQPTMAACGAA